MSALCLVQLPMLLRPTLHTLFSISSHRIAPHCTASHRTAPQQPRWCMQVAQDVIKKTILEQQKNFVRVDEAVKHLADKKAAAKQLREEVGLPVLPSHRLQTTEHPLFTRTITAHANSSTPLPLRLLSHRSQSATQHSTAHPILLTSLSARQLPSSCVMKLVC